MCGFAVFVDPGRRLDRSLLRLASRDLHHRGPDSGEILEEQGIGMVVRRLAILDPRHEADQPMADASGRYVLAYNGEIYNYRELRRDLQGVGVRFRTSGDTEVLLEALIEWGEGALERLEGMYAFALLDRVDRTLTVARDGLGIKPLYMTRSGDRLGFASEMRPLFGLKRPHPDPSAIAELLMFGWAAGHRSNIEGFERVPAGTVLEVDLDRATVRRRRFMNVVETLRDQTTMTDDQAVELIDECLRRSVRAHLASDVGYAVQLSGGVDSSLVTAIAAGESDSPLSSFGIRLEGYELDEAPYREKVVARYGTDHHEVSLNGADYADALPRAIDHMEGPPPHGADVFLMLLCDRIREHTKVVLTGEGADELFGGYSRYKHWRRTMLQERISRLLPPSWWPSLPKLHGVRQVAGRDGAVMASVGDVTLVESLFPDLLPQPTARHEVSAQFDRYIDRLFAIDQSTYLESLLVRQDKMSMAASVEARVPFTHLPFVQAVNRIPTDVRAPGGDTKPLLKRVAERYLPRDVVHRKKVGLVLPYDAWMRDPEGLGRYLEAVTDRGSRLAQYGDERRLRSAIERYRGGDSSAMDTKQVLLLATVEQWLRSLDGSAAARARG